MSVNKKTGIFILKLVVMVAVFTFVGIKLTETWHKVGRHPVQIDWRYCALIPLAFVGIMATNSMTWLWLTRRMGDHSPVLPLLGAYTFSQIGKYAPGKVLLVLMRLERTHRAGMARETCLLSTLLENAMYTLSGGLVGSTALVVAARDHPLYLVGCGLLMVGLLGVFHPRFFYWLINNALRSLGKGAIPPSRRFKLSHMIYAVVMFLPCWLFGGIALWAAVSCVHHVSILHTVELIGVFALSVSLGMFSLLPGGLGVREAVQAVFILPLVGSPELVVVVVALPRVCQILVELTLAVTGGLINSRLTQNFSPTTHAISSPEPPVKP
jgi:uncharacterized membrane protein YbhN (UPF0104 family)